MKRRTLTIQREVLEELGLVAGQDLKVEVDDDKIIVYKKEAKDSKKMPTWFMFFLVALMTLIFYGAARMQGYGQIALGGNFSITTFLIVYGGLIGTGYFTTNLIYNREGFLGGLKSRVFWRMLPVIVVAFTVILLVVLLGFSWLLEQLFKGASFDPVTASILLATMVYAVGMFWGQVAERLKASWLTSLFTTVMTLGILIAMATNSSRQWWQVNLSFLGTQRARNSWQFNVTLILAAFILIVLVDYVFVALREEYGRSRKLLALRILLTLLGLDLAAVGYFPNDATSHLIHTKVAGYLVYLIIILIISVRWLLPKVTRDFLVTSYLIGASLVVLEFAFEGIHYLSLTAFEIIAFLLAFTWLMMVFNHLEGLISREAKILYIKIPQK